MDLKLNANLQYSPELTQLEDTRDAWNLGVAEQAGWHDV
jgi:hypothetical protein